LTPHSTIFQLYRGDYKTGDHLKEVEFKCNIFMTGQDKSELSIQVTA
jgi:hypothetical protein